MYSMRIPINTFVAVAFVAVIPLSVQAQRSGPILAVFAHPDDERVIGPLLSKLAREGRETHLVIATDGSKGVRDFAKIPAGPELAAARTKEANCAAKRLGVRQLHILGLPDGGLASFEVLGKVRSGLAAIIDSLKPAVIITFGPEGGTGHPDHRLVGDVTTQIVQSDARYANIDVAHRPRPIRGARSRRGPRGVRLSSLAVRTGGDGLGQQVSGTRVEWDGMDASVERDSARSRNLQALGVDPLCGSSIVGPTRGPQ